MLSLILAVSVSALALSACGGTGAADTAAPAADAETEAAPAEDTAAQAEAPAEA